MKITKLARDRIPEMVKKNGFKATFYTTDETEYRQRLRDKLQEEVTEYLEDNNLEELADILEVVYALAQCDGASLDQLEAVRKKKAHDNGSFQKRLIIEYEK